jgi:hypothetical protein
MTGILFIGVVVVWISLAIVLTRAMTRNLTSRAKRRVASLFVFALLLALPVADEIIGGFQLRALCREGAEPKYDEAKVRGRTVYLRRVPHPDVPGVTTFPSRRVHALIPITEEEVVWLDTETAEVLVTYKAYSAKGGVLIRALGISNTDSPLTFEPSSCRPNSVELFKNLQVTSK